MAVKIRLSRVGKKNSPQYRIVAVDERKKRDGASLEELGTYNPSAHKLVQFHEEKIENWIAKGAVMTNSVSRICKQYKREKARQKAQ